jgi:hypothetical protein
MALGMDKVGKRIAETLEISLKHLILSILTLRFRSCFTMFRDTHRIYFFSFYLDKFKQAVTHTNKKD